MRLNKKHCVCWFTFICWSDWDKRKKLLCRIEVEFDHGIKLTIQLFFYNSSLQWRRIEQTTEQLLSNNHISSIMFLSDETEYMITTDELTGVAYWYCTLKCKGTGGDNIINVILTSQIPGMQTDWFLINLRFTSQWNYNYNQKSFTDSNALFFKTTLLPLNHSHTWKLPSTTTMVVMSEKQDLSWQIDE